MRRLDVRVIVVALVALLAVVVLVGQPAVAQRGGGGRIATLPEQIQAGKLRLLRPGTAEWKSAVARSPVTVPKFTVVRSGGGVVRTSGLDVLGRPVGVTARLRPGAVGKGSDVPRDLKVAGYKPRCGLDRSHLISKNMGGPGDDVANIIPAPVNFNRSVMRRWEIAVETQLRAGNEMFLRVIPEYGAKALVPHIVRYEAFFVRDKGFVRMLHQVLPVGAARC